MKRKHLTAIEVAEILGIHVSRFHHRRVVWGFTPADTIGRSHLFTAASVRLLIYKIKKNKQKQGRPSKMDPDAALQRLREWVERNK